MGRYDILKRSPRHRSCPEINFNSKTTVYDRYCEKCLTITPTETDFVNYLRSQKEYINNHLKIKAGITTDNKPIKFQAKKPTIREYTPKIINRDVTMGMWISEVAQG